MHLAPNLAWLQLARPLTAKLTWLHASVLALILTTIFTPPLAREQTTLLAPPLARELAGALARDLTPTHAT